MDSNRLRELKEELNNHKDLVGSYNQYQEFKNTDGYMRLLNNFNDKYVSYKNDAYDKAIAGDNASAHMLKMMAMEDSIVMVETHLAEEARVAKERIDEIESEIRSDSEVKSEDQLDNVGSMI